jgi:hypothetical protein
LRGDLLAHLIIPMSHVLKTLALRDVVDDDDSVGIAIVAVGDGSKSLLAGRIPLPKTLLTSTSLAFSPFTFMVFVFWVNGCVRSRPRWC